MTFNKFFSLSSKVGRVGSKQKCQFSTFSKQFNNSYQYSNPSKSQLKWGYALALAPVAAYGYYKTLPNAQNEAQKDQHSLSDLYSQAVSEIEDLKDTGKEKAQKAKETVEEAVEAAKEKAEQVIETVTEKIEETVDQVKETVESVTEKKEPQSETESKESSEAAAPIIEKKIKVYYKYILVGGGTATFSAMKAIRMKDPSADILIISDEPHPPYMRPPLSKELWFSEDPNAVNTLDFKDWQGVGRNAYYESKAYYEEVDPESLKASNDVTKVKLLTGVAATNLDVDRKVLHLANGKRLAYGKILLATGGVPKELPLTKDLPEDIKSKITTFRRVSDYQQLDAINKTGKHIVVIGGGFLGSELAYAIAKSGKEKGTKITQVFPEQGNMAQVFPRYLTQWTSGKMSNEGVELEKLSKVTNFEAEGDQVKIILDTGKSLVADHVVVATGIEPNVSLAKKAGLEIDTERGGILVNAELESRGDVFVAGDVSSYHDIALGRRRVEHHDHAVLSGRHAGENMVGPKKPYKHQSMFWSDLGPSIGYEAVGVVDSSLKTVGVWAKAPTDKENPHKPVEEEFGRGVVFYFREDRLVGVLTWNLFNKVELARELIKLNQFGPDRANELAAQFNIHGAH